jgi:hypothetical protein
MRSNVTTMGRLGVLNSREPSTLPIVGYFVVVGSTLVVLLLLASWVLPEATASFSDRPALVERPTIRIRSERKWPEKVVFDTNQPIFRSPSIEPEPMPKLVESPANQMSDQVRIEAPPERNPDAGPSAAHHLRAKVEAMTAFRPMAQANYHRTIPMLGSDGECCRSVHQKRLEMSKGVSRKRGAHRRLVRHRQ